MEYIIICLLGIFVGMSTAGYMFVDEINKKERKIANKDAMIKNRDVLIDDQCRKLIKIRTIIKSEDLYINKYEKIKSILFNDRKSEK